MRGNKLTILDYFAFSITIKCLIIIMEFVRRIFLQVDAKDFVDNTKSTCTEEIAFLDFYVRDENSGGKCQRDMLLYG
jgi:hypothetical protein